MSAHLTVAIVGGSLTGNKGAASMTQAVADELRGRHPGTRILLLSPYPSADRCLASDMEVHDFSPRAMLAALFPALLSFATARRWKPGWGSSGTLARADVVADVSGVSFMDGRGLVTLGYNFLVVFIPWALGIPVVKVAQALGPFRGRLTRLAARAMLPKVAWIGLRGAETARYAGQLDLENAEPAADVAFLLRPSEGETAEAGALILQGRRPTIVIPSAVVDEACSAEGIDYVGRMTGLIAGLANAGHDVVIIAHSAREGAGLGRTNDLPLCRRIARASGAELVDRELRPGVLRAAIAGARIVVTSRFHGMISGLATTTPTFVVGWSHKYEEVLADFGMEDQAVDFRRLSDEVVLEQVLRLDDEADAVRDRIGAQLGAVREQAELNITRILDHSKAKDEPS